MRTNQTAPSTSRSTATRLQRRAAVVGIAALAVALSSFSVMPASAAVDSDTTEANVEVASSITLSDLTPDFTLSGIPGATVATGASPVTMTVETNNTAGYSVTVQAAAANLVPADPVANLDRIPIADLTVRETGDATYLAMSSTTPVPVGGKASRSEEGGDEISNDYSIEIPFVNSDTYSVTLNYVATTL